MGFPRDSVDKKICLQCRRHRRGRFDPWVGKTPWRRKWKPPPEFLKKIPRTAEPGGLQSMKLQRVGHDCTTQHAHT